MNSKITFSKKKSKYCKRRHSRESGNNDTSSYYIAFLTYFIVLGTTFLAPRALPAAEDPITLIQAYEWAQDRSEDLKIRREDIQQSQARAKAALGEAYPDIGWQFTETWQDPSGVEELETQGFSGFVEKSQTESKFYLEQPLFSGLREFSAYSGFKRESARDALRLERGSFELFEQTANAFYSVLNHQTDLENTGAAFALAEGRVKELKEFLKLGKARDSEVFTAQAYAAALKAEMDQIQSSLYSARQELSYLTGRDLTGSVLKDDIATPPAVVPLEDALTRARNRSDIKAQQEEVEALRLRVRYEKGSYWPNADVTGHYYTERATFLDKIDWDVVLSVDFPLFQGGKVSASVKEARSAYRQSLLRLQKWERFINYSVLKTHGELSAAVKETKSLEEATEAAQKSYDSLRKEYRLGLVTNLDVLQALDFLQTQKSARDAALFKMKKLYLQLNVAMERML